MRSAHTLVDSSELALSSSEVKPAVMLVMVQLFRRRIPRHSWVWAGRIGVADERPGEHGADRTEGDDHPGGAGDRVGEALAVAEQGVKDRSAGSQGDGSGDQPVHR